MPPDAALFVTSASQGCVAVDHAEMFDDVSFQRADDGSLTGAFGRCIACDAYQWLGFSAGGERLRIACPACGQHAFFPAVAPA